MRLVSMQTLKFGGKLEGDVMVDLENAQKHSAAYEELKARLKAMVGRCLPSAPAADRVLHTAPASTGRWQAAPPVLTPPWCTGGGARRPHEGAGAAAHPSVRGAGGGD